MPVLLLVIFVVLSPFWIFLIFLPLLIKKSFDRYRDSKKIKDLCKAIGFIMVWLIGLYSISHLINEF